MRLSDRGAEWSTSPQTAVDDDVGGDKAVEATLAVVETGATTALDLTNSGTTIWPTVVQQDALTQSAGGVRR